MSQAQPQPQALKPAAEVAANAVKAARPYPNESARYRQARTALLVEELELRRHLERVAAQRRTLPPGGEVPQDYEFTNEAGNKVRLAELFGNHKTLVIYTWMAGVQRKRPCPMCSSMLAAFDGEVNDITQRVAFAVVGKAPIEKQLAWKQERGWRFLKFYSTNGDDAFTKDYRGESPDGEDWPAMNVFVKDGEGKVRHFWGGELDGTTADPGQDARGAPDVMPLWNVLDMTPEGRGTDWYPKLEY